MTKDSAQFDQSARCRELPDRDDEFPPPMLRENEQTRSSLAIDTNGKLWHPNGNPTNNDA